MNILIGKLLEDLDTGSSASVITNDGAKEVVCYNLPKMLLEMPETLDIGQRVLALEAEEIGQWEVVQAEVPA